MQEKLVMSLLKKENANMLRHEVGIFVSENFFYHKKVAIIFLA